MVARSVPYGNRSRLLAIKEWKTGQRFALHPCSGLEEGPPEASAALDLLPNTRTETHPDDDQIQRQVLRQSLTVS
jgi:hypothetical protein